MKTYLHTKCCTWIYLETLLNCPSLEATFFSSVQISHSVVSNSLHEVTKVLKFQLQHHSLQRNPRADLFRMDWLDLLAVQGTLKSLLQNHSSKASILRRSAFFTVQLSHPYTTSRSQQTVENS